MTHLGVGQVTCPSGVLRERLLPHFSFLPPAEDKVGWGRKVSLLLGRAGFSMDVQWTQDILRQSSWSNLNQSPAPALFMLFMCWLFYSLLIFMAVLSCFVTMSKRQLSCRFQRSCFPWQFPRDSEVPKHSDMCLILQWQVGRRQNLNRIPSFFIMKLYSHPPRTQQGIINSSYSHQVLCI